MVKQKKSLERLWKSSFPPAAVLGAFASFLSAASRHKPKLAAGGSQESPLVQISRSEQRPSVITRQHGHELEYSLRHVLGCDGSAKLFQRTLAGIAVDSGDGIYVLGDGEVKAFEADGKILHTWKAPEGALCLTAGSDGQIYFGIAGRVEIFSDSGTRIGGFSIEDKGTPANITSIKTFDRDILVADTGARCIRRYDSNGKQIGTIGIHGKNRGFMLPNRFLDMDVDAAGIVLTTDPGRHRISSWTLDGSPEGFFGKFGQLHPEDFVGCCNPVNLALTPDGRIVVAEKVAARIKVYDRQGKLLALIGSKYFDAKCTHFPLAVDSQGRIIVADPIRLEVKLFAAVGKPASPENKSGGCING
jgi:sugar lactone lactonase YvrE